MLSYSRTNNNYRYLPIIANGHYRKSDLQSKVINRRKYETDECLLLNNPIILVQRNHNLES